MQHPTMPVFTSGSTQTTEGTWPNQKTFFWDDDVVRTMIDISKNAHSNSYGCQSEPLVKLPLTHVVMDELYTMLQTTDRHSIIEDATGYDAKEKKEFDPNPMCYTWMNWLSLSNCVVSVLEYGKRGIHQGEGREDWNSPV